MPWEKLLGLALVPVAMALYALSYKLFVMPRAVSKKWQRLGVALRTIKKGTATDKDLEVVEGAKRLGLLQEHLAHKQGHWVLYYSLSGMARELFWSGTYPSQATIDGELEEIQTA